MCSPRVHRAALTVAATLVLTSCGSDKSASGGEDAHHLAAGNRSVGQVLVDASGRTLYVFLRDVRGHASACAGACLATWSALEGSVRAGDGVDSGLIGSITRGDGTEQATYAGWPLYYFAEDHSPGDLHGQGRQGAWFVLSPEGDVIERSATNGGAGY